jgi:hypothetical protein
MTTLFSERDPPATPEPPSVLKEATSYLYLVYWTYWYVFRLRVLGKLLRRSLGLLIVVELLGSASHAFTWEAQSLWVRLVLAFTLVAVASTLVYHPGLSSPSPADTGRTTLNSVNVDHGPP